MTNTLHTAARRRPPPTGGLAALGAGPVTDAAAELGRAAVRYGTHANEPDLDALLPAE